MITFSMCTQADTPQSPCMDVLRDLARCVEKTECFQGGLSFKQCLTTKDFPGCEVRACGGYDTCGNGSHVEVEVVVRTWILVCCVC